LIWSLIPVVPIAVIWIIAAGGLLYTAGVPIYAAKKMPFSTPIWHGFIVTASACFFAAIALGAATLT
jgi:hemolysin III